MSGQERTLPEIWADRHADDLWWISREKCLLALQSGHSAEDLRNCLAERDDQPLPGRVEVFLLQLAWDADAVNLTGSRHLLEYQTTDYAERILADRKAGKMCSSAGDRRRVVPDARCNAFQRAVREMGLGIQGV